MSERTGDDEHLLSPKDLNDYLKQLKILESLDV